MSVKLTKVSRFFGKQKAVDGISFEVDKGTIAGFIGPNGAGKSTTMKMITGYIPPSEGTIMVNGIDVKNPGKDFRHFIGYLPETNPLYYEMYVREYLQYVGEIYKIRKLGKRIDEVIDLTGLSPEKHKKIGQLSKGYKQRVGIAQAIIHDPEILILDESTSGLDPNQILEVRDLIKEIGREKTVILSTHIMQEVEAICDRIIVINQGCIVADDEKQKVISRLGHRVTVVVEFNKEIQEDELLPELKDQLMLQKAGHCTWLVESDVTLDIRQSIFDFAVKKGIAVLSMQRKEQSLESVFQFLTNLN
jgi:ABC-2 type transport system ATP-binding protein